MTKAKGAVYVTISPTFKKGMNYVIAITKKNILKKNLNWLNKTLGKNEIQEYF